jgi:hypothetical protein
MAKPPNGGRRISRRETERSEAPSSNGGPGSNGTGAIAFDILGRSGGRNALVIGECRPGGRWMRCEAAKANEPGIKNSCSFLSDCGGAVSGPCQTPKIGVSLERHAVGVHRTANGPGSEGGGGSTKKRTSQKA